MTVVTFETIKQQVDQLSPHEQARLIEHLSQRLADAVIPHTSSPDKTPCAEKEAWAQFFAVCEDIRTTYPHINLIRRMEQDRQERDATLWGTQGEQEYVHA